MKSCVYSGSFDPVTIGHLDMIKRASALFEKVYVAVLNNAAKNYLFDNEERLAMVKKAVSGFPNVEAVSSSGLLIELMERLNTNAILRGIRSGADLDIEQQMAAANAKLRPGTETIMLLARPELQCVSSTVVRELIAHDADVSGYLPGEILDMI